MSYTRADHDRDTTLLCNCSNCLGLGPDEEPHNRRWGPPAPRPYRGHIPPPPEAWWQRVEAAVTINHPDDPRIYEWPDTERGAA